MVFYYAERLLLSMLASPNKETAQVLHTVEQLPISSIVTELVTMGQGSPILFLHSGDGPDVQSPFLCRLAENHKVFAPSHPGFGHSDRPDDFKTVEDLAYFYLDFLDQFDLKDVTLVGSSFGGWIAVEVAIRSCARLRNLILIDPVGLRFSAPDQVDIADIFMLSPEETAELAFSDPARGKLDIKAKSDDDLLVISRNRVALCQYAWSPYMNNPRLKRWLHRVAVPTLVVWGSDDKIVRPEYGRRFAEAISNAAFIQIGKAGHYPHVESPDEVANAVFQFLSKERARPPASTKVIAQV